MAATNGQELEERSDLVREGQEPAEGLVDAVQLILAELVRRIVVRRPDVTRVMVESGHDGVDIGSFETVHRTVA
jgi:hypothetical protein